MSDLEKLKAVLVDLKRLDETVAQQTATRNKVLSLVYTKFLQELEKLEYENNSLRHRIEDMQREQLGQLERR